MNPRKQISTRNFLINAFSDATLARLSPKIEEVDYPQGSTLYRPYDEITHVYFPNQSMVSLVANTEGGSTTEIGIIGCEGATGLEVVMGNNFSPHEGMIQIPDSGHRISAEAVRREFDAEPHFRSLLLGFINKLMIQISQTTLCNRRHQVDERLARWLMMCRDRIDNDHLPLTQEFLAIMLGVTRVSVTLAASNLQNSGFIKYLRGNIVILDRDGLENSACECYKVVKAEYDKTECGAD